MCVGTLCRGTSSRISQCWELWAVRMWVQKSRTAALLFLPSLSTLSLPRDGWVGGLEWSTHFCPGTRIPFWYQGSDRVDNRHTRSNTLLLLFTSSPFQRSNCDTTEEKVKLEVLLLFTTSSSQRNLLLSKKSETRGISQGSSPSRFFWLFGVSCTVPKYRWITGCSGIEPDGQRTIWWGG